ncbi:PLD nuclease N-terminal domain-containing protein [Nostocoides australiense]|uniref:Putative membrane protein n=1 Tax=Nostocoides australiense Ben110 TaxID=1193182 RepID=W6K442_9MICO|nr:PLD nuclease N-terminal domain-containing protein [Tetrasphaera australiensis]MCA0290618.1 PLD nuclease N-terminal domain-containing protein [Actinomycetota bacterium]MCB1299870.1 PLDc_N domain-containing protein [Tetrasphaera sp.]CCH74359.1 putative membrane protein [Tetrasphaera australiensis Ben110]HPF79549.1 PLD nuclease N-terminal domain-containing protein [Tetrasphaera australiensis]HRW01296.1 PLD nuclease N-terminal domain-containing protein [Tetrasphaera sp.]
MIRFLPGLLALVLAIYTLVDCVQTPEEAVRGLPKVVWVFVILLFPFAGPAGWWFAGRPKTYALPGRANPNQPPRPKGPDDDPDFLRGL